MSDFNLGTVTAYGYAKDKGYTGTEDEYAELMASYADVAEQAAESAEQAAASATTATAKASEAAQSATAAASSKTAAETAQGGAETAAQTATTKAGEASTAATTATNKATEATTAATTATGKATEAAGSATTATTKAGEASTSATNAAGSATRAQEILDSIPEDYSQLSEDVSDLKDGFSDLIHDDIVHDAIAVEWAQNRIMKSGGLLTEVTSTVFANSGFITTTSDCEIEIASGYTAFVWSSHYNELGHTANEITSVWTTGTVNYTYSDASPYIIICVQKNPSATITADEAQSAVKLYATSSSIFALKSAVETLADEISEATESIGTVNENVGTVEKKDFIITASEAWSNGSFSTATVGSTLAFNTSEAWKHTYFAVQEHHIYNATLYATASTTNVYGVFTDNDLKVFSRAYTGASIRGLQTFGEVEAPTGATRFYIITYTGYTYASNVAEVAVYDLQTQITDLRYDTVKPFPVNGQILYNGDTKVNGNYIVNAVAYDDGVIIACRSNGVVVRIAYDGTEETLLTINGSTMDWRLCWMDSNENVYVSPHASYGSMQVEDRGLYKLVKGASSFTKVISLYNPSSSVTTETDNNNDTIWTMCEDRKGNLYAGVYAHTIRANPAVYRSVDGGNTWTYLYNFKTSGLAPNGMHIHTIIYDEWKDALYCIVGEVNTIFKSTDGAETWTDLHVELNVKGSAMCATPYGILIGSDGAYNCEIDLLLNDDKTHNTVFSGWANTVFAIRRSDITGFVYAFTKVDSSVNTASYYPPQAAVTDASALETWLNGSGHDVASWTRYYNSVIDKYPEDAIRPQHCAILISRDGGIHWDVLIKYELTIKASNNTTQIDGFWTTGFFKNGECLTGRMEAFIFVNPIIISEGKHKYVSGGCDLNGEIFIRTNSSSIVEVL